MGTSEENENVTAVHNVMTTDDDADYRRLVGNQVPLVCNVWVGAPMQVLVAGSYDTKDGHSIDIEPGETGNDLRRVREGTCTEP